MSERSEKRDDSRDLARRCVETILLVKQVLPGGIDQKEMDLIEKIYTDLTHACESLGRYILKRERMQS